MSLFARSSVLYKPALARGHLLRASWLWAVVGVIVGLAMALVLRAPAQWLGSAVSGMSQGRVQLIQTRGTVWSGSAQLMLSGGTAAVGSTVLPGRVDWQIRPGWLALNLQLRAECCTAQPLLARLSDFFGNTQLDVSDSSSVWPASLLSGLGTPWNTVQVSGSLQMSTQGFSARQTGGRWVFAGRAVLDAQSVSSRLSTLKPMGSYRLVLAGGNVATVELLTLKGALQLSGTGRLTDSGLRFEGVATAEEENLAALSNLLNIIGRRTGARSVIKLG